MHRARVTAVGNTKAQADGKWLNIIGNKAIAAGDLVWTDGRCIYGNSSEGGGTAPIINSSEPYVPIFMKDGTRCLYHKGKLKAGWQDTKHELMASCGSEVVFSDYYRALDVSISQSGEVQELITEKYVYGHGTTGYSFHDYQDSRGAKVGIYFDGDEREFYWRDGLIADMEKLHFLPALLCSDFCQAPIFYFAKRHFEKTLDNIVSGIATLLYVDWLPQCNGFAVSATI